MLPLDREFETTPEAIRHLGDELLQPPVGRPVQVLGKKRSGRSARQSLCSSESRPGPCQKKVVSAEKAPASRKSSRVSTLYMRCGSDLE